MICMWLTTTRYVRILSSVAPRLISLSRTGFHSCTFFNVYHPYARHSPPNTMACFVVSSFLRYPRWSIATCGLKLIISLYLFQWLIQLPLEAAQAS